MVTLSPQGSSDDGTDSGSSSPTRQLRRGQARHAAEEEEPARERSPHVVVRRYQGSRNRAGRSLDFHRPPK